MIKLNHLNQEAKDVEETIENIKMNKMMIIIKKVNDNAVAVVKEVVEDMKTDLEPEAEEEV